MSPPTEYNIGFLAFCDWNLNTLSKENFNHISLQESHNVNFNYDIISLALALALALSMLKDIEPIKVKKKALVTTRKYVKHFSGATTKHMKSYVIPSKEFHNDLVILHCDTNDLRSNKSLLEISTEISILALDLKNENINVMISGIVPRRDKLNDKGIEVKKYILTFFMCRKRF